MTEAMACGCVPIVTNIPASMMAIDNGDAGFYFKPGNFDSLSEALISLDKSKQAEMSEKVIRQFEEHLSAESIAKKMVEIYKNLKV